MLQQTAGAGQKLQVGGLLLFAWKDHDSLFNSMYFI